MMIMDRFSKRISVFLVFDDHCGSKKNEAYPSGLGPKQTSGVESEGLDEE